MGTVPLPTKDPKSKTKPPNSGGFSVSSTKVPVVVGSAVVKAPEAGSKGISGTGNYSGDVLGESNSELLHQEAYGQAGTRSWGAWEEIARTDEAVAKALDFVIAPVRDANVDIEPVDDSPEEIAKAEFISYVLENVEPGWPEFLSQTCRGSLGCGFAIHELVWSKCTHESLPGGEGWTVSKLAERLPSSVHPNGWIEEEKFGPDGESYGYDLKTIRQLGPRGPHFETIDLPADKVLLNTWNRNGNNYLGYSAFRAVYYPCKIRRELARIIAISHVRESCGIPICFAEADAIDMTDDQRESMETFMLNVVYHENANLILPRGWKMDWLFSKGADKASVLNAFNMLGLMILEQVGAQQLYLGTSDTGSRAVGSTHAAQADVFTNGLLGHVASMLNGVGDRPYTGLVRKLIDNNWGAPLSGLYPKLKLTAKKAKLNVKERFEAMKLAKDAGLLTVTTEDENEARAELGLSPIDELDREAKKTEEQEAKKELMPPAMLPNGQPDPKAPNGKPEDPKAKLSAVSDGSLGFVPRRTLRPSEVHLDLTGINEGFDRARQRFADGMRPLAAELLMKALPGIKSAMADGDATDVGDVELDMSRVDAFVGSYLEAQLRSGYSNVKGEMKRAGVSPLTKLAKKKDPKAVLEPMRKHVVKKIKNRLSSDLEKEAIDALRSGGSAESVVSSTLEYQTAAGAFSTDAGLITTKAFSMGREEFAEEHADQIESCELSAVLDKDTCGPCEQLDGTEFEFGSDTDEELTPPLSSKCNGGDNCRCLKVFNFKKGP